MSPAFHHSLDHVALNLDLRRPRTAAGHLRQAFHALYRLDAPGNLPSDLGPWLNQSLLALGRADYRRAGIFLSEAIKKLPSNEANRHLVELLGKLQCSLEQSELPEAASMLRAFNDSLRRFRKRVHPATVRPA